VESGSFDFAAAAGGHTGSIYTIPKFGDNQQRQQQFMQLSRREENFAENVPRREKCQR
jgi:hypothetical protein